MKYDTDSPYGGPAGVLTSRRRLHSALRRVLVAALLVMTASSCSFGQGPGSGSVTEADQTTGSDQTTGPDQTTGSGAGTSPAEPAGSVYYSSADQLMRYDVAARTESVVFDGGDSFTLSPELDEFAWHENDFFTQTTRVHVHQLATPSQATTIELSAILESSPEFVPGADLFGALARSSDAPDTRTDFVLFDDRGQISGRIPHVKDFSFSPDGSDVLISAEALDDEGKAIGWALAVVQDFHGADQQTLTISEFTGWDDLPVDLAVAPSSTEAVFTHHDHLHTVALRESASPQQVTRSDFAEIDAAWSPDGGQLIFVATAEGAFDVGCGELRIAPAHPPAPVVVPDAAWDDAPADPSQPVGGDGKVIHACDSESMYWVR